MHKDRRNSPNPIKMADAVIASPIDKPPSNGVESVETKGSESTQRAVSPDLKQMETEVNGGSYYKESDSKKTDEPDTGDRTTSIVGEMSPPKNVPSPNSSSTRKKLRVDGVLPKKTLARSNSRTASLRRLLPDETAIFRGPPLQSLSSVEPGPARTKLLLEKLRLCSVPQAVLLSATSQHLNSSNPNNLGPLERKREAIKDIVQETRSNAGKAVLAGIPVARAVIGVIEVNLFRVLPSMVDNDWLIAADLSSSKTGHDKCEAMTVNMLETRDNTFVDPDWGDLEPYYDLAHHFVCAPFRKEALTLFAERGFGDKLLHHLMHPSIDERERDFCKVVLHRLYSVAPALRPIIRTAIQNCLLAFVFENSMGSPGQCTLPPCGPTGVREVLEVLTCITQGFCLPIKERHVHFLKHVLLPLHLPRHNTFQWYFTDMYYCLATYVKKDGALVAPIIEYLHKHWPRTDSKKQAMMIEETAQLISLVCEDESAVNKVLKHFLGICKICLGCGNVKMVEMACSKFWDNEKIITGIWHCHCDESLRALWSSLQKLHKQTLSGWDPSIKMVALSILKLFQDFAPSTFLELSENDTEQKEDADKDDQEQMLLMTISGDTLHL